MTVVRRALEGEDHGIVSAHGLAETYAVLTTLPVSPRIGPETAHKLVVDNILARFEVVALTAREYGRLVSGLANLGVMGGAVYDAIHVACARKANVERLYTFNVSQFRRLAADLVGRIAAP